LSTIKVKRGLKVNLPSLEVGEPAFTTDTKEFYIGSSSGNIKVNGSTVADSTTNGNILIEGAETTIYEHPTTHAATMITEDSTHRFITDTERTNWGTAYTNTHTHANTTALNAVSGTNTGDETTATIKTKLGTASTSTDGYLTAANFTTFNNKQAALGFTPENVANKAAANGYASLDANSKLVQTLDASKIVSGTIDIARLPAGALERLVIVANQTARFALTTTNVQLGDTVKQTDTGLLYIVKDEANLANAGGYEEFTAGSATSVPWSGITSKPTTLSGYGITDGVSTSTYTASDVLTKIKTVDGSGSGLDADTVDSYNTATTATASTIAVRDTNGKLAGDILGNAATATNVAWTGVTSKPTTLSGYGITDSIFIKTADDTDDITVGTTNKFVTAAEKTAITHSNRANLDTINQNMATTDSVTHNKVTVVAGIVIKEMATPTAPASTYYNVYTKTDGKLYLQNSAGTEKEVLTDVVDGGTF
jgi:hypothetical protein